MTLRRIQFGWRGAIGAACVALAAFAAPAPGQIIPSDRPDAIKGLDIRERLGQKVSPDLSFTNSDGAPVKLGSYFNDNGKPVVLAMVYFRCPMQCPTVMNNMLARFNELDWSIGEKFNVVIVTFDPTEGPAVTASQKAGYMAGYARPHPASLEKSWAFLSADAATARTLADQVGFDYRYLPESNEYSHPAAIFVLTPKGELSRYLYGVNYVTSHLRMALLEASDGRIGSTLDRVLMFCFHFDPQAGAYALSAFRVMQVGASSAALVVGLLLGRMWFVERRRRAAAARVDDRGAVGIRATATPTGLSR